MRTQIIVTIFCCVALSGCVRDISRNPTAYKIDYSVGTLYRLKEGVFLQRLSNGTFSYGLYLCQPDATMGGIPGSIEDYRAGDKRRWPEIVGVVEAGTELKVEKITREYNFEIGYSYDVQAIILNKEHTGKRVFLDFVSKPSSIEPQQVDPTYLEAIQ